jgi:hypothetical protein
MMACNIALTRLLVVVFMFSFTTVDSPHAHINSPMILAKAAATDALTLASSIWLMYATSLLVCHLKTIPINDTSSLTGGFMPLDQVPVPCTETYSSQTLMAAISAVMNTAILALFFFVK